MQKMQAIDSRMKQRREERRGGEGDLSTTNQQQQHAPNYLVRSSSTGREAGQHWDLGHIPSI
jgi:hypothetical protein